MRIIWSICLIMLGVFLLFYSQMDKQFFDAKQDKITEAFKLLGNTNEDIENTSQIPVQNDQDHRNLLKGARGIIQIPKIHLKMMIFAGANSSSLKKGIGMIEPEKEFGVNNVGLAGHRAIAYGKQFNRLDELAPNDKIEIKTQKNSFEFIVVKKFVVKRKEVGVLADKKEPLLTLVTCTPIGKRNPTDRLIVQAKLKQKG